MKYTYIQVLNKRAAKKPVEEEEYDMNALVEEWRQARKQRELGYGGAFVRSLPISLLIAGLSGVAGTALSGDLAAGAVLGGISGVATSALNTLNNAHATPEEAGTSFFATF